MAKKQHISRVEPPVFDASKFAVTGNLPTAETVNQSVAEVTGVEVEKVVEKVVEKKDPSVKTVPIVQKVEKIEKSPKVNAPKVSEKVKKVGKTEKSETLKQSEKPTIERGRDARGALNRVGITALVDKDLLKQTKILAIQQGLSMSDIINDALTGYLNPKMK